MPNAPTASTAIQLLAVNLLALKARARWTTSAVAEHSGLGRRTLQRIERLQFTTLTVDTVDRLARGLGVRTGSLVGRRPLARREGERPVDEVLAENLLRARARKGWTQEALSQHSGVSMFVIAHIERKARSPDLQTLERLAGVLGVSLEWLLSEPRARSEA